jgi:hypothetical protein
MESHPVFSRIRLHSDMELAAALNCGIVERQNVHEWPLSCVQRLLLKDGKRLIYKSQLPPTVESGFYECAVSPLLPAHRVLGSLDGCEFMTFECIDAPLLRDKVFTESDWIIHGRALVAQIGAIGGNPPAYLDIASAGAWLSEAESTFHKLDELVRSRWSRFIKPERVDALRTWAESAAVRGCICKQPRLLHGDLKASQVFLDVNGYRVIDWQRPVIGPPEVDLVSFLIVQGIDARPYVACEIIGVFWFLFLRWAVIAQAELFPDFSDTLFCKWASTAMRQILDQDAPLPPAGIPPP